MGSEHGFEYRYRIWTDAEIISRYNLASFNRDIKYLFEIRTNFIVEGRFGDGGVYEVIDSEMYDAAAWEFSNEWFLGVVIGYRLKDYWMSEDEIQELVHKALACAKQSVADRQHASYPIIPIAVDLDVCTVQQEGELINATIDRAIRSKHLFPLHLFQINKASKRDANIHVDFMHQDFLRNLSRGRVKNIDQGLSDMKECPICLRHPTIGAEISRIKCNHAFHYHCIVKWLESNRSCPICRQQVHNFMIFNYVVEGIGREVGGRLEPSA